MDRHRQALSEDEAAGAGARAAAHARLGGAHPGTAPAGPRALPRDRQDAAGEAPEHPPAVGGVPAALARGAREAELRAGPAVGQEKEAALTPSLLRRLAALLYESLLVFAVAFFASWVFLFASGGREATSGIVRHELQALVLAV